MFDPTIGRWQSKDPKSFDAGDTNLYRFVGNHPSYATDPSGLDEVITTQSVAHWSSGGVTFRIGVVIADNALQLDEEFGGHRVTFDYLRHALKSISLSDSYGKLEDPEYFVKGVLRAAASSDPTMIALRKSESRAWAAANIEGKSGGVIVGRGDSSVSYMSRNISPEVLENLRIANYGNAIIESTMHRTEEGYRRGIDSLTLSDYELRGRYNRALEHELRDSLGNAQFALSVVGLIPVLGAHADLVSAGISAYQGDYQGASISIGSIFFDAAVAAKFARSFSPIDAFAAPVNGARGLKLPATDASLAGSNTLGYTLANGDVFLQPGMTRAVQAHTLRHEGVHAFLSVADDAPLAAIRQRVGMGAYNNSAFFNAAEEILAEGIASKSLTQGIRHAFNGAYTVRGGRVVTPLAALSEFGVGATGLGLFGYGAYEVGNWLFGSRE
jgi:hypothetical protein